MLSTQLCRSLSFAVAQETPFAGLFEWRELLFELLPNTQAVISATTLHTCVLFGRLGVG